MIAAKPKKVQLGLVANYGKDHWGISTSTRKATGEKKKKEDCSTLGEGRKEVGGAVFGSG